MKLLRVIFYVFIYIVIVCPISNVNCHGKFMGRHYEERDNEHSHSTERPCEVCPQQGVCVPRVQCPAHVRAGAQNPECHLDGTKSLGVCCFTGRNHAAKPVRESRASVAVEDLKEAHTRSQKKLSDLIEKSEKLMKEANVIVKSSAPSYGHHLSLYTYDTRVNKLGHGGLQNLFAAEVLKARQVLSDDDLAFGFTEHTDGPFCPPPPRCPALLPRYRSIEGHCNNPIHPSWGAANTGFTRLLPPDYSDGVWAMRSSRRGLPLPSARLVSSTLLLEGSHPSRTHNLVFMQFGQFIAHDITSGVVFTIGNGSAISCCSGDGEDVLPPDQLHWACAPIIVTPDDAFYGKFGHRCINFVRTQLAPNSACNVGYAQQMNGVSHYIDLSQLYGSSEEKLAELRAPNGLLKVFNDFGRELPPLTNMAKCLSNVDGAACFDSGDNHGNQIISLTVFHTIWTREHNRVARALSRINPIWSDDKVFLETRRIVQAEFQNIIYHEWLPLLLGPEIMKIFGLTSSSGSSYDPRTDPSVTVEFSTSAMRFGHSVVDSKIMVVSPQKDDVQESIFIPEVMFQPSRLRIQPFLDRLLIGLSLQPMQSVDPFVSEALSRYLFHGGNPFGLDLAAINIQRGRDYGVRPYNDYRKLIGLDPFPDFTEYPQSAAQRLASVYNHPGDVDLWVGGLLEEHVDKGVVGATFAQIIADQFSRLKTGDRYFFENGPDVNPGAFTPSQLAEINKVTFSRILCDNSDGIELTSQSPNAFLRADLPGNEPVPCNSPLIPSMDLNKFVQQ